MTLIELIVAMGVASAVLVISLQLYVVTQRALDRQQVQAARLGDESDMLSLLRRDVRQAAYVAPESTARRLVLVGLDGGRTTYEADDETVERDAPQESFAWPVEAVALAPRFEYPGADGERGGLVRVTWGPPEAQRSITLNLRNYPTS
jgi:type II secretory pathway pseudopilin PulG